jgi:5-methyltetrahydrofolate--homocysteine methyltransferase
MAKHAENGVRGQLEGILAERIMILDGSMGALIYTYDLNEADFRGQRFARHPADLKNCTEALVLSQPKIIEDIHRAYLEAGADII